MNGWPQGSLRPPARPGGGAGRGRRRRSRRHRPARCRGHRADPGRRRRDRGRPRDGGADRSVRAAAVLGCDGADSTVRRLIGASMRDLGPADRWLVLDVRSPAPLPVWPGAHQVCDSRRPATFMPVTGDRYRWECRMARGGDGRRRRPRRTGWPRCSRPVDPGAVEIVRAVEYTFRAQVADRWRAGRVLPGRGRRAPEPAVRRAGAGARAARRAPAGLEAGRRPRRGGGRRPARHLPGGAGAARPRADPASRCCSGRLMTGGGRGRRRRAARRAGRRPADPGGRPAGDRQPDAAAAARAAGRAPRPGRAAAGRARSCRSPRCSSTGGAAGWTTSSDEVLDRGVAAELALVRPGS